MTPLSLYRRVLGARFESLPAVLQRFHDTPGGGRASGVFRVERASGWLRNRLARLAGMPEAGTDVRVSLHVEVEADRERWVRQFDEQRVETVQWAWGNLLMEASGPVTFACALLIDGSHLNYEPRRTWFSGVPLPRWLAPMVYGSVTADESGWRVMVRILAPVLGEVVRYEGRVVPE